MDLTGLAASPQTQAQTSGAFSQLTNNFDTFLTLLTTQLRNQNPLEPLDTEKFTEQLVQFASVEQSIKTNTNLEALISLQTTSERDSAIGFVGKTVSVESPQATLGANGAEWSYELPRNAESVAISIVNSAGVTIARQSGQTTAGAHAVAWNGLDDNGAPATPGNYTLVIEAKDAAGEAVTAEIQSLAQVSGVVFDPDGPMLETSNGLVTLASVRRVTTNQ